MSTDLGPTHTARDEILNAIPSVQQQNGTFTVSAVLHEMHNRGTSYADGTIRTHITSRMCADAPAHHAVRYPDLGRVALGIYRLL